VRKFKALLCPSSPKDGTNATGGKEAVFEKINIQI
jgi:hypothetical protein